MGRRKRKPIGSAIYRRIVCPGSECGIAESHCVGGQKQASDTWKCPRRCCNPLRRLCRMHLQPRWGGNGRATSPAHQDQVHSVVLEEHEDYWNPMKTLSTKIRTCVTVLVLQRGQSEDKVLWQLLNGEFSGLFSAGHIVDHACTRCGGFFDGIPNSEELQWPGK